MRIGIIGQPCIDEIQMPGDDQPRQSLGGVLYSYAALERIMAGCEKEHDSFAPLTWLSNSDVDVLNTLLSQFPHMENSEGLWRTDSLTNRVLLNYSSDGSRTEHCPNVLPRLTGFQLTPALLSSLDGLFVNMISGFDVGLDTLDTALNTAARRPYVHLDIHALVLGPLSHPEGTGNTHGDGRKPRGVRKWKHWLNVADSVQLNEMEVRWLGDPEVTSEQALLRYIERQRDRLRLKRLIVTRAEKGATMYDVKTGAVHHASPPELTPVDTTGSGDVFGAAFINSVLAGETPVGALRESVKWASWSATLPTINDILTSPLL